MTGLPDTSFATRRGLLLGTACAAILPRVAAAEKVVDLTWPDLLPEGETALPPVIQGLVDHEGPGLASSQPASSGVRTDLNGQIVRLAGFVVPVEFDGSGVTAFLLVPFVGACVHVPPPPANQLVFVTTSEPYETEGMFEAVTVTGMFGTAATSTQLAQVGYALSADAIEPYRF